MRWQSLKPVRWKRASAEARVNAEESEIAPHLLLGRRGEELAVDYLLSRGYRLVATNFKLPVGRSLRGALIHAEIDCIAYEGATLCFVEVKTRSSSWFTTPESNVDLRKQRQIARAARVYRRLFGLRNDPFRYDVVSVVLPHAEEEGEAIPRIELLRNFWTDAKFRKRHWMAVEHIDL